MKPIKANGEIYIELEPYFPSVITSDRSIKVKGLPKDPKVVIYKDNIYVCPKEK